MARYARTGTRPVPWPIVWKVRLRPVRPAGWWFDVALLAGLVAVTVALIAESPLLDLDVAVRDWCDEHRPAVGYWIARVFNFLGQGGIVLTPLASLVAGLVALRHRSVRPFLPVVAAFVLTYFTIGPLKIITDRPAGSQRNPPEFFLGGLSYPSGHVVNAIVWYAVIALLVGRWLSRIQLLALRLGPPVVVVATTTYLSFHWVSDGLAAILLGVLLERVLRRIPWDELPLGRRLAERGWDAPVGIGD